LVRVPVSVGPKCALLRLRPASDHDSGHKHGPPGFRLLSKALTKKLTAWQTVAITLIYLYAVRNFSSLVGLASPEPMANMYDAAFFRATWVLTALDAGFWTAMKIKSKRVRDLASIVFTVFYLFAAEKADEKVRKVRGMLTVEHLRVSWNKGTSPYLNFFQGLMRPRLTRWPARALRIPRPSNSDYKEPISAWLYYDGPLADLEHHDKIVLDVPGGGFVAMDPRCHDDLLFSWAAKTGLPVLALDYKKAPEFPYPHALNECFDAYTTIMKSKGRCIGMSGRETPKVVITGDSAGANLAVATTLMIIEWTKDPLDSHLKKIDMPLPDGLVVFYPSLDINIGNWMSDEQMALIRDRRLRRTNKSIVQRKSRQYDDLVGTPHHSDDEDDASSKPASDQPDRDNDVAVSQALRSPHPEFSHGGPRNSASPFPPSTRLPTSGSTSHHPHLLHTRLAVSSMLSYFNDRVLTPEMMRAMIILYIGPHNRPDFSSDYHLSPVLAPDALLAHFPKTYFLTGERDPLVDDTVIFAGRLRKVKEKLLRQRLAPRTPNEEDWNDKDAAEVILIPGISHGFLQFPTIYPPAWKLMDRAGGWIKELFLRADNLRENERWEARAAAADDQEREQERVRSESSGDEDKPLEISMTRMRRRTSPTSPTNRLNGSSGQSSAAGKKADQVNGAGGGGSSSRADAGPYDERGKKRKGSETKKSMSLVKLGSEDDLLGRRMGGLVSGLTGMGEDD
jgi:acetyl esterase/lipase